MSKDATLKQILKNALDVILNEAEKNQDFAKALEEAIGIVPKPEMPKKDQRKENGFDPFVTYREKGIDNLRGVLESVTIQDLRQIVRKNRFDPGRLSEKWKTKERFIVLILEQVEARERKGEAFRTYGEDQPKGTE